MPDRMGDMASFFTAKAGGLADVSAALITALFEQEADVHVALPDYRAIFSNGLTPVLKKEIRRIHRIMPDDHIHLARDRAFYYINRVYSAYGEENIKLALAFQREVISHIVPQVQPDLIHCNDWMTGLNSGDGPADGNPLSFYDSQHTHRKNNPGLYRGPGNRCRLFLAEFVLRKNGRKL